MDLALYAASFLFIIFARAEIQQISITQYALMRDKKMTSDVISLSVKETAIACANVCLGSDICKSYFYKHTTGECQLHAIFFTSSDKAEDQKGFKYYYILNGHPDCSGREEWCPVKEGFQLLSEEGPCIQFHGDTKSWYEARKACVSYSPCCRLVVVDNKQKSELVRAAGRAFKALVLYTGVWMGLSEYSDNAYRWVDGKDMTFTDWSRRDDSQKNQRDCALFYRAAKWWWTRETCKNGRHYICEIIS